MSKGIMTVLLHTVEYDTGNVIIDADAEETLHDIIHDRISSESRSIGNEVLELEDDEENRLPVDVSWKIINPEAEQLKQIAAAIRETIKCLDETIENRHQWRQLAKMFYEASTDNVVDVRSAVYQYEELIKQTTHE